MEGIPMNKLKGFGWIFLGVFGVLVSVYYFVIIRVILVNDPEIFQSWEIIWMKTFPFLYGPIHIICFHRAFLLFRDKIEIVEFEEIELDPISESKEPVSV
jgi:hypothetical protein